MEKLVWVFEQQGVAINGIENWLSDIKTYKITKRALSVSDAVHIIKTTPVQSEQCVVAIVGLSFCGIGQAPNEAGLEILEAIKNTDKNIRALVFSARDEGCFIRKVMSERYGAKGFISKTADRATLIKAIDTLFEGNTFIQQELVSALDKINHLYDSFTKQEKAILNELQTGKSNQEVADSLTLSLRTVENHLSHIYTKTEVSDKYSLFAKIGICMYHGGGGKMYSAFAVICTSRHGDLLYNSRRRALRFSVPFAIRL